MSDSTNRGGLMDATVKTRVCDLEDGRPAVTAISWKGGQGTVQNDLCREHASMLSRNGHTPRRGRKPGSTSKPTTRKRTGTKRATTGRKKSVTKRTGAKNATRKKTTAKRSRAK
jgi:hypothetical protein